jgi:hypothetical protein
MKRIADSLDKLLSDQEGEVNVDDAEAFATAFNAKAEEAGWTPRLLVTRVDAR